MMQDLNLYAIRKLVNFYIEISLMNGSKWRIINVGGITKTILWYPAQRIKIEETDDREYTLTNLDTSAPDEISVSRFR